MRPPKYILRARLERAPPLNILRHPTMHKFNAGARVLIYNGKVYFLSTDDHICCMPMPLACWFNWNDPISADMSGIATDCDDPFSDYIYYKPIYVPVEEVNKNVP